MEEVLAAHPDVAECAVIGVADELKGQLPLGFLCSRKGSTGRDEVIVKECVRLVRDQIGPVAAFKLAIVVERLPKTRSGKILRGTMAKIADSETFKMPATIDDPAILDELRASAPGDRLRQGTRCGEVRPTGGRAGGKAVRPVPWVFPPWPSGLRRTVRGSAAPRARGPGRTECGGGSVGSVSISTDSTSRAATGCRHRP